MSDVLGQCREFLSAVFDSADVVEFRTLGPVSKQWGTLDALPRILAQLEKSNASGAQCYFGANPRKQPGGSTADAVALARCVFADFDGGVTVEDAWSRVKSAGLPMPTVTLSTGGGVHCWWRLEQPVADARRWSKLQKILAESLRSDPSVHDWPRIMRLPGFVNHKYEHKPAAVLVDVDGERVYSLERLSPTRKTMGERSRAFIERGQTASGDGRRETMFAVACDLRDRGWSPEDAVAAIMPRMQSLGLSAEDVADCPRQIRNAWRREPRTIGDVAGDAPLASPVKPRDPFEVASLVSVESEWQYLAGLLDVLEEKPLEARELAGLVQPAMLSAKGTADVHAAILHAFELVGEPSRADVRTALRGKSLATGKDWQSDPVRQVFVELLADPLANRSQAVRLSRQAAAEVADLHRRRRGILLAADYVLGLRLGESDGVSQLVEEMQSVRLEGPDRGVVSFAEAVEEWSRHEQVPTVRTLLEPFDRATDGGLPMGGLTTFVAPPSAGKSAMAVQLVVGALLADADLRVVYGLGEMDAQSLARRMACVGASILGHPAVTMQDAGARSPQARETLRELVGVFGDRLSILQPPLTVERLDEQVQRTGARLAVVDYMQLIEASGESRVEQLDGIVGRLRNLAIRRQAAVVVISSTAKATGEGSRIGQFARGTAEADYASELLYLAAVDEHEDVDGTRGFVWQCKKARNLRPVDVELRFDGALQTFSAVVEPFVEFTRFEPGRPA